MNLSKRVEQKVIAFIDEKKLIAENDRVLVALSGGPDSVFLLKFLSKYSRRFSITIGAFHLNHKLRKKSADDDADFCMAYCDRVNIPFYLVEKDVKQIAHRKKISIEEAGRLTRYVELGRIAELHIFNKIATAHNVNDNTETVLLNLIKGTGLKGISGIPVSRGKIIRPLLNLSKQEIISYLKINKISYRTDKSNLDNQYERNFIRNDLIPRIKNKLNPNLDLSVFRSSQIFRNYSGLVEDQLNKINKLVTANAGEVSVGISDLKKVDKRLIGDFFIYQMQKHFGIQLNYTDIIAVQKLVEGEASKKSDLSENLSATRERDRIIFSINKKKKNIDSQKIEICINQKKTVEGKIIHIDTIKNAPKSFSTGGDIEYIDGEDIDEKFYIRKWKTGDKFKPFGMSGTKNISDYLNALKIPASEKKNKIVLINRNRIVWVVGYRIDDRFRITANSKKVVRLCLK